MKQFIEEQETGSKPPEPRGDQTPDRKTQRLLEEESGETLLDETMPEDNEEPVEWDGSEAELVADETAAEYEEQNTGIKLKYSLKAEEVFSSMLKTQFTQTRIALIAAVVLLGIVSAVASMVQASVYGSTGYVPLAVVCVLLIFVVVLTPLFRIRTMAREAADGSEVKMKIYPDHIEMGRGESRWEIPLDGTRERVMFKNLILLYIDARNMVILPLRCVEPAVLPEVQAMIFAGTQPKRK